MSIFVAKHIKSTFFIIYILDMLFLSIFQIYKKSISQLRQCRKNRPCCPAYVRADTSFIIFQKPERQRKKSRWPDLPAKASDIRLPAEKSVLSKEKARFPKKQETGSICHLPVCFSKPAETYNLRQLFTHDTTKLDIQKNCHSPR